MKKIDWDDVGYETQAPPSSPELDRARREMVRAQARYIDVRLAEEVAAILRNPLYDSK